MLWNDLISTMLWNLFWDQIMFHIEMKLLTSLGLHVQI